MSKSMNIFKKTIAGFTIALVSFMGVTANAQINSVSDLLGKVRADSAKAQQENQARMAKFRERRNQQSSLLSEARRELSSLEGKARRVQGDFDSNQGRIDSLNSQLKAAQGDFGEVFGLARAKAGEFKVMLDNSLITAEYPTRTEVLGRVADSKALPSTDDLNAIWQTMLGEIQAQRQIKTFDAPVANVNDGAAQSVMRVGPFAAFTKSGADFLSYSAPSSDAEGAQVLLAKLPRQPGGKVNSAAGAVASAGAGALVYAPIDPTRGELLKSFERFPTVGERINQGGIIGKIIIFLAAVGIVFGVLNIIRLMITANAVRSQKRSAQASKSNPLGRIMMAYQGSKNQDTDSVELVMDEAILKESPRLEFGLNLLKLGAAIAPLLGLLGTVTGMIKTFQAMMIYGTGDPQLMAGGISEALVTTMLGLIAAIPLLILHSFCSSLARGVQSTLEEQSAGIVARHTESRGA